MSLVRWMVGMVVVAVAGAAAAEPVAPERIARAADLAREPVVGRVLGDLDGRTLALSGELVLLGGTPVRGYSLALLRAGEVALEMEDRLLDADLSARGEVAVVTLDGRLLVGSPGALEAVDTGGRFASQARWDPAGDRLALTLWPRGRSPWDLHRARTAAEMATALDADIAVWTAADGGVAVITDPDAHDYNPVWSPDGAELLFVSTRTGYASFFLTSAVGGADRQLTNRGAERGGAAIPVALSGRCAWDDVTGLIVYETRGRDGGVELWTLTAAGEGRRRDAAELLEVAGGRALLRRSTGAVDAVDLDSWAGVGGGR